MFQHLVKHRMDIESYGKKYKKELREELRKKEMRYVIDKEDSSQSLVSLEEHVENMRNKREAGSSIIDPMDCWRLERECNGGRVEGGGGCNKRRRGANRGEACCRVWWEGKEEEG